MSCSPAFRSLIASAEVFGSFLNVTAETITTFESFAITVDAAFFAVPVVAVFLAAAVAEATCDAVGLFCSASQAAWSRRYPVYMFSTRIDTIPSTTHGRKRRTKSNTEASRSPSCVRAGMQASRRR